MDKNSPNPKTASQMLHNELTAKGDMSVEIATLRVQMNHLESRNTLLSEEVQRLRERNFALNDEAKELSEQRKAVETHNDLLYKEVVRVRAERDEVQNELNALRHSVGDASFLLCDWDGYYNHETKSGNVEELAKLIEEAFITLQGRSWRDPNPEEAQ